jgi:hypothetical protein
VGLTTSPPFVSLLYAQCWILNISRPSRPARPVMGTALLHILLKFCKPNTIPVMCEAIFQIICTPFKSPAPGMPFCDSSKHLQLEQFQKSQCSVFSSNTQVRKCEMKGGLRTQIAATHIAVPARRGWWRLPVPLRFLQLSRKSAASASLTRVSRVPSFNFAAKKIGQGSDRSTASPIAVDARGDWRSGSLALPCPLSACPWGTSELLAQVPMRSETFPSNAIMSWYSDLCSVLQSRGSPAVAK